MSLNYIITGHLLHYYCWPVNEIEYVVVIPFSKVIYVLISKFQFTLQLVHYSLRCTTTEIAPESVLK